MRPELFRLVDVSFPSYFVFLLTGFLFATAAGALWARRVGLDADVVVDLGLAMLLAGVAGARLLHVVADGYFWDYVHLCTDPAKVDWPLDRAECVSPAYDGVWDAARAVCHPQHVDCFAWAKFWAGGLTYYGGLIGAVGYAAYFLRRERFPFWRAADMAGFTVALGLAWGRMGCFLAGCCFGVECHDPWAAFFPAWSPASESQFKAHRLSAESLPALPVHPTQLYESLGCLVIAAVAYGVVTPRKRYDGQVFLFFLGTYSVLRAAVEALRSDDRGGLLGLSTSQVISVAILAALWPTARYLRRVADEMRRNCDTGAQAA